MEPTGPTGPTGPWRRGWRPGLAAGATVLAIALAGGALWAGTRDDSRRAGAAPGTATSPATGPGARPPTTQRSRDARTDAPSAPAAVACGGTIPARHQHLRFRNAPYAAAIASQRYLASFRTSCGRFTVELDPKAAPVTTFNFVFLAQRGFYDSTWFHRILTARTAGVDAILGGDPQGDGQGGPGYSIKDELPRGRNPYRKYSIAMLNTGMPDTAGSQFFISTADNPKLPRDYTVFGQVIEGRAVVDRIARVPVGGHEGTTPTRAVWLEALTISIT